MWKTVSSLGMDWGGRCDGAVYPQDTFLLPNHVYRYSLKALLDTSIDACDTAFNLREAILDCRYLCPSSTNHMSYDSAYRLAHCNRGTSTFLYCTGQGEILQQIL